MAKEEENKYSKAHSQVRAKHNFGFHSLAFSFLSQVVKMYNDGQGQYSMEKHIYGKT